MEVDAPGDLPMHMLDVSRMSVGIGQGNRQYTKIQMQGKGNRPSGTMERSDWSRWTVGMHALTGDGKPMFCSTVHGNQTVSVKQRQHGGQIGREAIADVLLQPVVHEPVIMRGVVGLHETEQVGGRLAVQVLGHM